MSRREGRGWGRSGAGSRSVASWGSDRAGGIGSVASGHTFYGPNFPIGSQYPGGRFPNWTENGYGDLNQVVGNRRNWLGPGATATMGGNRHDTADRDVVDHYMAAYPGYRGFGYQPSATALGEGMTSWQGQRTVLPTAWVDRDNSGVAYPRAIPADRSSGIGDRGGYAGNYSGLGIPGTTASNPMALSSTEWNFFGPQGFSSTDHMWRGLHG